HRFMNPALPCGLKSYLIRALVLKIAVLKIENIAAVPPYSGRSLVGMTGGWGWILAVLVTPGLALAFGAIPAAAQKQSGSASAAPVTPCGGREIVRDHVSSVVDGRDFALDDGRTVHLAAVEVPLLPRTGDLPAAPGGVAAEVALANLMAGAQVVLRQADFKLDRYGRTVAYAETSRGGSRHSVEADMVSAGFARVADDIGSLTCAYELLRREDAARRAKLGLWALSYYQPISADRPADIVAQRSRFALVEGRVVSVHASGPTLYINFGRRWSEDFSVTVRKRNEREFAAGGVDLRALAGRRVRVRGWVEAHGNAAAGPETGTGSGLWHAPWIEAVYPEQIELIGPDDRRMIR
ncbi:MAG: thermonuclease family protein, partial [Xanthobacteraceae bacterium]